MVARTGGDDRRDPVADPSANVLQLVGNATKYLEELHKQSQEFLNQKLALAVEASQRERAAESDRVDKRWAVDNEAIKVANQMAVKQAEVLANQMAENAEALRASMAKQAETLALNLQQMTGAIENRLKIVEEKQFVFAGASKGSRDMWGWISAGVLLLIAIYAFWSK